MASSISGFCFGNMSFLKLGKTFVCCATSCSSSKDGNPGKVLDEPREELKQALSSHEAKTYEKQEVPKGRGRAECFI